MGNKYGQKTVRVRETIWRRLKSEASLEGQSLDEFFESLLNERDRRREKAKRLQRSPLHRVEVDAL
ncbi:Uncharacterised protein [Mycobacteroides abscessus subsp. abscessus]|nr:Uncharacterised protein [Mycobacteroides abscessus subsp. abscessus]